MHSHGLHNRRFSIGSIYYPVRAPTQEIFQFWRGAGRDLVTSTFPVALIIHTLLMVRSQWRGRLRQDENSL